MDHSFLVMSPVFRGLTPDTLADILSSIPVRTRKFAAADMIAQSGEEVRSLMIIVSGIVKGEMTDFTGRVIKIEDIPAPGAIAPAFIFGSENRFPVNVIAVSDCELLLIDRKDFMKIMVLNDAILVNFLNMISNRSQFLSEKIKFLNFKTIRGKLAQFLLQRYSPGEKEINVGMTQSEIADFFGVARPSVARAMGELVREKYINASGKKITIIDHDGLKDLVIE